MTGRMLRPELITRKSIEKYACERRENRQASYFSREGFSISKWRAVLIFDGQ